MEKLTRFERTRLISARALQLSLGAPPLVKIPSGISMIDLANHEFEKRLLPLMVLRKYPNGEIQELEVF